MADYSRNVMLGQVIPDILKYTQNFLFPMIFTQVFIVSLHFSFSLDFRSKGGALSLTLSPIVKD